MSSLRLDIESEPVEFEKMRKDIQRLEVEQEAIKNDKDEATELRLKAISRELADLKEKANAVEAKWRSEKETIEKIKNLKKQLDEYRFEIEKEEAHANLQRVAELKYGKIPQLMKEMKTAEKKLSRFQKGRPILKERVIAEDVANVVSRWTGIPVTRLMEEEARKLQNLEDILQRRVVGQEAAIIAISNALRRARAGIAEENRPLGSFMFLGPTGVGKTETAKALAEFMFNDENALIRLDMSEYMENILFRALLVHRPAMLVTKKVAN